jgi:RNA polymerase sigma factor (sigma-70 family)
MTVTDPVSVDAGADASDRQLVERSLAGDRGALARLLARHQPFIYNLAFRMVLTRADAEDVTQEIAIKVMTKLATFDPAKAAFRTWLYRIVANHVINMKTRGHEGSIPPLDRYYAFVTEVPDEEPDSSPELQRIAADLATGCVMGVLLCLEREQRLAFLLAVAFDVSDAEGSEILETSRDAFRKLVSRARARLRDAIEGQCGLVNPAAPCRCRNKVTGLVRLGAYGGKALTFVDEAAPRLESVLGDRLARFDRDIYPEYTRLVRQQPFYRGPELTDWLRRLLERPDFQEIFDVA